MHLTLRNTYAACVAAVGSLLLASCADNTPTADDLQQNPDSSDAPLMMFTINTVNQGNAATSPVNEVIKTLRIILIHESGNESYIEANRLIDTHQADNRFTYMYQKRTVPGKKKFYLIANEASVSHVQLTQGVLPGELTGGNLASVLAYFQPNMPDAENPDKTTSQYTAAGFEEILQGLYFESQPAYSINGNEVCLPYSAFYSGFEIKATDSTVDFTDTPMYLVPAATKFSFKFINERTAEDVAIDYLAVRAANQATYLFANLDPLEQTKSIVGEDYYWIDWLHLISQASQENSAAEDNANFNNRYGWIKNYFTPVPEDTITHYFVPDGGADSPEKPNFKSSSWILPVASQDDAGRITSTTTEYGPLYVAESRYFSEEVIEPEVDELPEEGDTPGASEPEVLTQTVEKYYLKLKLRDISANVDSKSLAEVKEAETEISNLKSLFRNTSVLITITLREGGVNIYAETVPWNKKVFYGYVKDEDEIK